MLDRLPRTSELTDEELVRATLDGDRGSFAVLMRRHNQRLFRTVRAVLRDDAEVEDAVQQAYIAAYRALADFRGDAKFSTWITRIALREAFGRIRKRDRFREVKDVLGTAVAMAEPSARTPEEAAQTAELARVLERAIDALPEQYRIVLILRDVQQLDTEETAAALDISEENVRVRLHRARALVRDVLSSSADTLAPEVFRFDGARCDRIVASVMRIVLEL